MKLPTAAVGQFSNQCINSSQWIYLFANILSNALSAAAAAGFWME
jgi:hypothetical protein